MNAENRVDRAYQSAREQYAERGVDTEEALRALASVPLSLHCWQGDDVQGFESGGGALSGSGLQVTGAHPGRARTAPELREDLSFALSLLPGRHRVNLHAMYGEFPDYGVDRNEMEPSHFDGWIDWAGKQPAGLDFNATLFSHPKARDGLTLSSSLAEIRDFWIEHVIRCRRIAVHLGRSLDSPCVHNLWIPDGSKDHCPDRLGARERLLHSLDQIYDETLPGEHIKDSVESKLFGIGSETFVVGSHEFYLAYALKRGLMVCLDMGHFHPTESVADKISALLPFFPELLLHVSRGVRWDSDHVVLLDDGVVDAALEIVRARALSRVHLALDFFDASLNRVGAWVTGARALQKALLLALLEPGEALRQCQTDGRGLALLALREEWKTLPFGAVWEMHCARASVPGEGAWLEKAENYEQGMLSKRSR